MKRIIHSASEEAPCNELLLVIYAKKGRVYNHASTCIVEGEIGGKFIPANVASKDRSILPIAWCLASDAYKLIGFDKEDKEALFEIAKNKAWPWYNEEGKIKIMKQTVEEAANEYCRKHITDLSGYVAAVVAGFKAGARWQAKQSPWTSIDESLPDNKRPVLCSSSIYDKVVLCWNESHRAWCYPEGEGFFCDLDQIDCWMDIPEV